MAHWEWPKFNLENKMSKLWMARYGEGIANQSGTTDDEKQSLARETLVMEILIKNGRVWHEWGSGACVYWLLHSVWTRAYGHKISASIIVVSMETRHPLKKGLGKPCLKLVIMLCRNCPSNMAGWSIQTTNERMRLFAECWGNNRSDHTNTHSHINNLRMCILNLCCLDFTLILCFRLIWNMRLFPPAALCSEERQHVLF